MAIESVTGTGSVPIVDKSEVGFNGLTADHFMRMLITQLKYQDPLEPVGNDELLNQISMMRNLQSNIELGEAMKSITSNQQLSTAASFIGLEVTGASLAHGEVTGTADRAFLRDGKAYVGVEGAEIPLENVNRVEQAADN